MPVFFHKLSDLQSFQLKQSRKHQEWIKSCIEGNGYKPDTLNIIFCTDEELLEINREHLDHDEYTDIITFDLSDSPEEITADIFISVDRVKENAKSFQTTFDNELRRVMIHGVLHLMGKQDKTTTQKAQMRKAEDEALKEWDKKEKLP